MTTALNSFSRRPMPVAKIILAYLAIAGMVTMSLFICEEAIQTTMFGTWPAQDAQRWDLVLRGTDTHVVIIPNAAAIKKLKVGQRIYLMGQLDRGDEAFSTQIMAVPGTIKTLKKSDGYANYCELVGRVPFSAAILPAQPGKVSLANLAIEVGGKVFNGVAFRQLAAVFDRVWTKDSFAQLAGRIRRREFIDNEGDTQVSVEVVAEDKSETRVLKAHKAENRFGNFGVIGDESDQIEEAKPAAAPAV